MERGDLQVPECWKGHLCVKFPTEANKRRCCCALGPGNPRADPCWREPALSWVEGGEGAGREGSEGALGRVPNLAPRTLCCPLAQGCPKEQESCRARSPGKVGKDWSWIPQCPSAFFAGCRVHVRDTSWCSVGPLASLQPLLEPTLLTPSEGPASGLQCWWVKTAVSFQPSPNSPHPATVILLGY